MKSQTGKNVFPILYHAHHSRNNEDLSFWINMAQEHPGTILELGCGTGRVLLPLWTSGYKITGLDHDRSMLSYLLTLAKKSNTQLPDIFQASFLNFRLNTLFDLILMPCNTFSTLSVPDQKRTLKNIERHLKPNGVFVFSIPNPSFIKKLPSFSEPEVEDVFHHPLDGEPVQVSSSWKRTQETFTLWWNYDHLLPNGEVSRTSAEIIHYLHPFEIYIEALLENGFQSVKIFGDYDQKTFKNTSPHLIIQASPT